MIEVQHIQQSKYMQSKLRVWLINALVYQLIVVSRILEILYSPFWWYSRVWV